MTVIAELVEDLLRKPRPVLCLDTCDFLDVVRGVMRDRPSSNVIAFDRILSNIIVPDRLQIVLTYLVTHEWRQNLEIVRTEVQRNLENTNTTIERIANACKQLGIQQPSLNQFPVDHVIQRLIDLAERLMDQAVVLEKDAESVEGALERLMNKQRPSHNKEIKDSIHLEHYLKLCRILRERGFPERCVFVSSNSSDYWQDKSTPTIHPDLSEELGAFGPEFYGKLNAAVGQLRL